MDEPTTIVVERTGPAPLLRIGLVGVAAAALIAVGILAAGASASPGGTLAANTTISGVANSSLPGQPATGVPGDWGRGPGGPGGFGDMRGFGQITITAISGSSISLATADGWTRTITVDSATTYDSNGTAIKLTDLKVGDEIRFSETRQSDGTFKINAVDVVPPHVDGTVASVTGSTITVTEPDGTSTSFSVTSTTTYRVNGATAKLSDVKVGMHLMATGTKSGTSITATSVFAGTGGPMGDGDHHGFMGGPANGTTPNATTAPSASGTTNG